MWCLVMYCNVLWYTDLHIEIFIPSTNMNISNLGLQTFHFLDLHYRPYSYLFLCIEWMNIWNLACGVLPRGRGQHILIFIYALNEWILARARFCILLADRGQGPKKHLGLQRSFVSLCFPSKSALGMAPNGTSSRYFYYYFCLEWMNTSARNYVFTFSHLCIHRYFYFFLCLEWMNIWSPAGCAHLHSIFLFNE